MAIPVVIVDPARQGIDSTELTRFAHIARQQVGISGQIEILITSNRRLQKLNRRFRKKNKPTDVLSFPRKAEVEDGGDIAISSEIAAENAARYGHAISDELKVLILHGMLHLSGYDHERDNGEMAARETVLRKRLGLPTALIQRSINIHHGDTETRRKAKIGDRFGRRSKSPANRIAHTRANI